MNNNRNKKTQKPKANNASKQTSSKSKTNKTSGEQKRYGTNKKTSKPNLPKFSDEVRLNKYLSNTGICSRREADTLISTGVVSVNGKIITEMGYKVKPGDVVKYDGASIKPETKRYVLMNKPKDFVSKHNDPWGRKSIYPIISKACKEYIFPVDAIDRDSSGLILLTNDSDLTKKLLENPKQISQVLIVNLNKAISPEDFEMLKSNNFFLNLSRVNITDISILEPKHATEIGIEMNTNKHKFIYKIFEKLGYEVTHVDRTKYGNLTKKDLPRGHFRHLTEQEVSFLKMN